MRRCHYCNTAPGTTKDHIVPRALHGPNTPWNYIEACHDCNADKGHEWPTCPCGTCTLAVTMFLWCKDHGSMNSKLQVRQATARAAAELFREELWAQRVERAGRWEDAEWIGLKRPGKAVARKVRRARESVTAPKDAPVEREYAPRPGTPAYADWLARLDAPR